MAEIILPIEGNLVMPETGDTVILPEGESWVGSIVNEDGIIDDVSVLIDGTLTGAQDGSAPARIQFGQPDRSVGLSIDVGETGSVDADEIFVFARDAGFTNAGALACTQEYERGAPYPGFVVLSGRRLDFENAGTIDGGAINGVELVGTVIEVDNSGQIEGAGIGVEVEVRNRCVIVNTGTIIGGESSVVIEQHEDGRMLLQNAGTLIGDVRLEGGVAVFENRGEVVGDVIFRFKALNDQESSFDGRGGRVDGEVHLETGNDIAFGSFLGDKILGGEGRDLIRGLDGDDDLRGGNGNDALVGGRSDDLILGGSGADRFVFTSDNGGDLLRGPFETGRDRLDFSLLETTLEAVLAASAHTIDGTRIDLAALGASGSVLIEDLARADLDPGDIIV